MGQENIEDDIPEVASASAPTTRQLLFIRYFTAILIDLAVLNLFDEYWERVSIDSFTISLLVALLLQVLLKLTLAIEHKVAGLFHGKEGMGAKVGRFTSAWIILFVSKLIILAVIDIIFGERVLFSGPHHGVLPFIVVVVVMLVAEELVTRFYRRL